MKGYVLDYINENEFKKLERALKKYNMLAYKKLIFDCVPSLRNGSFQGEIVSKNSKEGIIKYVNPVITGVVNSQIRPSNNLKSLNDLIVIT